MSSRSISVLRVRLVTLALALLVAVACARSAPAGAAPPAPPAEGPAPSLAPKRIVTAQVSLSCDSVARARAALASYLASHGGTIASVESDGDAAEQRVHLVVRLPEAALDGAIAALGRVGTLEAERRESDDVTRAYVDTDARLRNLRRTEERLLALLAQPGGALEDVLAVERELSRVRGETEQLAAELRALEHAVALASLTVDLSAAPRVEPPDDALAALWSLGRDARGVMARSAALLVATFAFGARVLLALVPWSPLALPILWTLRRRRARAA